jgi:allophanate hydrolase
MACSVMRIFGGEAVSVLVHVERADQNRARGAQPLHQHRVDIFRGQERLAVLAQRTAAVWREIDLMVLPTAGTIYRIAEIEAQPIARNSTLGHYTNFTNLLDLSALAVPNGFQSNGLPAGVTLLAPAFHDPLLAAVGAAFQRQGGLPLGATGAPLPPVGDPFAVSFPYVPVAVFGAHLSGMALNGELLALGARLRRTTQTTPEYRLYALPDGKRPGLVRCPKGGVAIELEVWDVPVHAVGAFLGGIALPLGLGTVALADGGYRAAPASFGDCHRCRSTGQRPTAHAPAAPCRHVGGGRPADLSRRNSRVG